MPDRRATSLIYISILWAIVCVVVSTAAWLNGLRNGYHAWMIGKDRINVVARKYLSTLDKYDPKGTEE